MGQDNYGPLVAHKVSCRNGCTGHNSKFNVHLQHGEKPKNIYLCSSCQKYGIDREWDSETSRKAKCLPVEKLGWNILSGIDFEKAKKEIEEERKLLGV